MSAIYEAVKICELVLFMAVCFIVRPSREDRTAVKLGTSLGYYFLCQQSTTVWMVVPRFILVLLYTVSLLMVDAYILQNLALHLQSYHVYKNLAVDKNKHSFKQVLILHFAYLLLNPHLLA